MPFIGIVIGGVLGLAGLVVIVGGLITDHFTTRRPQ